jgi:hypothetical protein
MKKNDLQTQTNDPMFSNMRTSMSGRTVPGIVAKLLLGFCVLGLGNASAQFTFTVGVGQCLLFPFTTITDPNGFFLTYAISNTSIAMFSPGAPNSLTVYVPPSDTNMYRRDALVCGVNFGQTNLRVSDIDAVTGVPFAAAANVTVYVTGTLSFNPSVLTVSVSGREGRPALTLSGPAPEALTILLSSPVPDVSVPASVVIPAGSTSVTVPVIGLSTGATVVEAAAGNPYITNAFLPVTITP